MRTTNRRTTRSLGILAPTLAVWTFLALVSGAFAQQPNEVVVEEHWAEQSLRVSMWLSKNADEVYRRGEPLNITFQTNEDSYAVVYHIDVEGLVSVVWPTSRYNDGFVFGGHQYRLPARGGERMRAGDVEGQGFFHTVVSKYPFDLRDLELDFHHEEEAVAHDFYVAGDPYLAMNEVNYVITGLEDPSEFAISNFLDYYVHRVVDHPRFMCFQCHDDDAGYEPYRDHCTIDIQADYTWVDEWWDTWGYFPPYVMPVYVYVDPWAGDYWVNYWYRPWYHWPHWGHHHWQHTCWDWGHSPYWRHDAYAVHRSGNTRHRPLDRSQLGRDRGEARTKSQLVTNRRPTDDRIRVMKDRKVLADTRSSSLDDNTRDRIRGGGATRPTDRTPRSQTEFDTRTTRERTSPGLRIDPQRDRGTQVGRPTGTRPTQNRTNIGSERRGNDGSATTGRAPTRVGKPGRGQISPQLDSRSTRRGDSPQTIKPVKPRTNSGGWINRRNQSTTPQRPTPPPSTRNNNRSSKRPETIDRSRGSSGSSRGGSSSTVKPRSQSKPPSKPASPPPSRSSGGKSSGKSSGKSGGGSAKRSSGGRG